MNITECPQESLSGDFGDIIIDGVAGKLDFRADLNGEAILQETYHPDAGGRVYIRDIATPAEMYRPEHDLTAADAADISGAVTFDLEFREGAQKLLRTVKLYACEAETAGTLTPEVLKSIPLTRCFNKTVCPGQKEYISFYGTGTVTLVLTCTGEVNDLPKTLTFATLPGDADAIRRLDVSPDTVAGLAGIEQSRIVNYILFKDKACRVRYGMNRHLQAWQTFLFVNSYGAQETFTCYGDSETERKWTRQYGAINGRQRLTRQDMEMTHTANTGYITREQAGLVEDMLHSRQTVLLERQYRYPVVMAEETFKVKSRRDELVSVEFKYRYASAGRQYRFSPQAYFIFNRPPHTEIFE